MCEAGLSIESNRMHGFGESRASESSVSVAMATYNGSAHIRRQLESLVSQARNPSELIVTDDASDDDTLDIVKEFACSAPFPVFVSKNERRLGYRANFIQAALHCKSDLIAFCDQD